MVSPFTAVLSESTPMVSFEVLFMLSLDENRYPDIPPGCQLTSLMMVAWCTLRSLPIARAVSPLS